MACLHADAGADEFAVFLQMGIPAPIPRVSGPGDVRVDRRRLFLIYLVSDRSDAVPYWGSRFVASLSSPSRFRTRRPTLGRKVSVRDVLGLDALSLIKDRSFAVFVVGSLLICIPLQFYYAFTNPFLTKPGCRSRRQKDVRPLSEIVCMLVMPWFFIRLGVKG